MRIDQRTSLDSAPEPSPDRPETVRRGAKWLSTAVLALLMAGTSWAVASWVSPWLVPPYLILMALLLSPGSARPPGDRARTGSDSSGRDRPARPGDLADDDIDDDDDDGNETSSDGPASAGPSEDGSEPESGSGGGPASKSPKARRGKARVKKARAIPEPTEATWLQVAPGKFVRVEASEGSSGPAGPHTSLGVPAEVPATPQPSESDDPAPSEAPEGLDPIEEPPGDSAEPGPEARPGEGPGIVGGPVEEPREADPTGEVESEPPGDRAGDETAGPSRTFEAAEAVDGITPQAEAPFEGPETTGLALSEPPEASGGRERVVEDWTPSPLADVPPEPADDRGAPLEGIDPTETAVDETVLDDADPCEGAAPPPLDSSRDADPSETEPLTSAPPGTPPPRWPWRLAPRARTRVGHPPLRSIGRESPPRRPLRSSGAARRPPDP